MGGVSLSSALDEVDQIPDVAEKEDGALPSLDGSGFFSGEHEQEEEEVGEDHDADVGVVDRLEGEGHHEGADAEHDEDVEDV